MWYIEEDEISEYIYKGIKVDKMLILVRAYPSLD